MPTFAVTTVKPDETDQVLLCEKRGSPQPASILLRQKRLSGTWHRTDASLQLIWAMDEFASLWLRLVVINGRQRLQLFGPTAAALTAGDCARFQTTSQQLAAICRIHTVSACRFVPLTLQRVGPYAVMQRSLLVGTSTGHIYLCNHLQQNRSLFAGNPSNCLMRESTCMAVHTLYVLLMCMPMLRQTARTEHHPAAPIRPPVIHTQFQTDLVQL